MIKPELFKNPLVQFIGAVQNLFYGVLFYRNLWFHNTSNSEVFMMLLLFLLNIIWILSYYALHLRNDEANMKQIRLIMLLRILVFLSGNVFNTISAISILEIASSRWYIILTIWITLGIAILDSRVFKQYKDIS